MSFSENFGTQIEKTSLSREVSFWITWMQGVPESQFDVATTYPFKFVVVESDGDVVTEGPYGAPLFYPALRSGQFFPAIGVKILSSAFIPLLGGTTIEKSTTATGIWVFGGN